MVELRKPVLDDGGTLCASTARVKAAQRARHSAASSAAAALGFMSLSIEIAGLRATPASLADELRTAAEEQVNPCRQQRRSGP